MKNKMIILLLMLLLCNSALSVDLCVDPGHGGTSPGTLTYISNYSEKDINLQVALSLQDTLEFWGCQTGTDVIYTRLTDTTIYLGDRSTIANQNNAAYFISIHHNASSDPNTVQGSETWYGTDSLIASGCNGNWTGDPRNNTDSLAKKNIT